MGDFKDRMNGHAMRVVGKGRRVFTNAALTLHDSIVNGSPITGSPGQPVDSGRLKASWIPEFPEANRFETTTNVPYARIIEDNLRGATLRSSVGGFHSVALTVAGFSRIVDHAVAEERGNA